MKFDIARKVVRFQNGQYGIRRWVPLLGYQFLGLKLLDDEDFWWGSIPEHVAKYAAGSETDVRARLAEYLASHPQHKPIGPGYDKGRPA